MWLFKASQVSSLAVFSRVAAAAAAHSFVTAGRSNRSRRLTQCPGCPKVSWRAPINLPKTWIFLWTAILAPLVLEARPEKPAWKNSSSGFQVLRLGRNLIKRGMPMSSQTAAASELDGNWTYPNKSRWETAEEDASIIDDRRPSL